MDEEQIAALVATATTNAVNAAIAPLTAKVDGFEASIAADKKKSEKEAKRVESFSALSDKFPKQASMIAEEMKKGAECSVDFSLSVVEAESARKIEAGKTSENEEENEEDIETGSGDAGETGEGEKSAKDYSAIKKGLRG